ncbi:hypothetical protein, partial [Xanthomonas campestris]|uniref:hypothetical protein n=1 Tax=Xanthomonas campestris TaxID=339 RepID=UPI002B23BFE5
MDTHRRRNWTPPLNELDESTRSVGHRRQYHFPYFVAPEKPPITQRPQGLDVCSGVPELPVFATLKAGFWQFPLMHTRRP